MSVEVGYCLCVGIGIIIGLLLAWLVDEEQEE